MGDGSKLIFKTNMPDDPKKITELDEQTTPLDTDILPIIGGVGTSPINKKITIANLTAVKTTYKGSWKVLTNNLIMVAHYKLNDSAEDTVVLDSSPFVINGVGSRNTSGFSDTGKISSAFNFIASNNDIISLSGIPFITKSFSFACWIKPNGVTGLQHIIQLEGSGSPTFFRLNENLLECVLILNGNGTSFYSTSAITSGVWTHVVLTYDGTTFLKFYINSVLSDSYILDIQPEIVSTVGVIGAYYAGGDYFDGEMDDFRIYNNALSQDDINTIYNLGNGTEDEL